MTPFSAAKAPPLVCSVFSEALRKAPPLVCSVFSEALRAREELLECCCSRSSAVARLAHGQEVTRLSREV